MVDWIYVSVLTLIFMYSDGRLSKFYSFMRLLLKKAEIPHQQQHGGINIFCPFALSNL